MLFTCQIITLHKLVLFLYKYKFSFNISDFIKLRKTTQKLESTKYFLEILIPTLIVHYKFKDELIEISMTVLQV